MHFEGCQGFLFYYNTDGKVHVFQILTDQVKMNDNRVRSGHKYDEICGYVL